MSTPTTRRERSKKRPKKKKSLPEIRTDYSSRPTQISSQPEMQSRSEVVIQPEMSSRAKRGILVLACTGRVAIAGNGRFWPCSPLLARQQENRSLQRRQQD